MNKAKILAELFTNEFEQSVILKLIEGCSSEKELIDKVKKMDISSLRGTESGRKYLTDFFNNHKRYIYLMVKDYGGKYITSLNYYRKVSKEVLLASFTLQEMKNQILFALENGMRTPAGFDENELIPF